MSTERIASREQVLRVRMEEAGVDCLLINDKTNQLYLTDFSGGSFLLFPLEQEPLLFVYPVNYEEAKETALNCRVELLENSRSVISTLTDTVKRFEVKNLGFDRLDAIQYKTLTSTMSGTSLEPKGEVISEMRAVKDDYEIGCMKKAAEMAKIGFDVAVVTVKPGVKEIDVAAEMEYAMRKEGSQGAAFDTIVASGRRTAFPHGGCTAKKMLKGDLVVLDFGVKYKNYAIDITRTLVVGDPTEKQKEIFEVVRVAHEEAFKKMKAGTRACDVDAAARKVIEEAGYGEKFVHSLGHGVGLEIHEPPSVSRSNEKPLKVGNVVTDEPGIYMVDFGGVRIEDTVLIREDRAQKLTKVSYPFSV